MDIKLLEYLCRLSMLDYTDEWLQITKIEMSDIVALMDTLRESDVADESISQRGVTLSQLREDIEGSPVSAEILLQNATTLDDQFVVPKMLG